MRTDDAREIAENLTPDAYRIVDAAAEMSGVGVTDFIRKLNEPWEESYYVVMEQYGIVHIYVSKKGETYTTKQGAEILAGPLDTNKEASDVLNGYEVGWYACLYELWRSGPYQGDQEIDWRVIYGHRPNDSNYQFACGPWDTEEDAKAATAFFAANVPLEPFEDEWIDPEASEEVGYDVYEGISGLKWDAARLATYPVRPPLGMNFNTPPLPRT